MMRRTAAFALALLLAPAASAELRTSRPMPAEAARMLGLEEAAEAAEPDEDGPPASGDEVFVEEDEGSEVSDPAGEAIVERPDAPKGADPAHDEADLRQAARLVAPIGPGFGLHAALDFDEGWAGGDARPSVQAAPGELPFPLGAVAARYDIPLDYNEEVAHWLAFFQGRGRNWFGVWLQRSGRYVPYFRSILREHELPEDLVYLSMIESGFSMKARSHARAVGPWQFIPGTGRMFQLRSDFWVDERQDFEKSTHAAARFLRRLHGSWDDWYLAWAGYNAGPGRVTRAIDRLGTTDFWEIARNEGLPRETRNYVPKLLAAALISKHPEDFGFEVGDLHEPVHYDVVELEDATDLAVIARSAGVTVEDIEFLNPELRRWATPPVAPGDPPYRLRLPAGTAEPFAEAFAQVAPNERLTFRAYEVQPGDTLGKIALMWDTTVEAVMRTNHIKDARRLRIGQELIVPVPPDALPRGKQIQNVAVRQARAAGTGKRVQQVAAAQSGDGWHVLKPGETLGHVALRYDTSVEELKRLNQIRDVRKVQAGTKLRVK